MSKNQKERIKELRTLLHHYNVEYYVHSRSLVSDFEFDQLMKELEENTIEQIRTLLNYLEQTDLLKKKIFSSV